MPVDFPIRNPLLCPHPPACPFLRTFPGWHLPPGESFPFTYVVCLVCHILQQVLLTSPHEQNNKFATNFIWCTCLLQVIIPKSACVEALREERHHARDRTTLPFVQGFSVWAGVYAINCMNATVWMSLDTLQDVSVCISYGSCCFCYSCSVRSEMQKCESRVEFVYMNRCTTRNTKITM